MSKKIWYIMIFSFFSILIYYFYNKNFCSVPKIAIIQMASHPSLDAARKGFLEVVKNNFGEKNIEFIIHNCQGSMTNLENIVSQVAHDKDIALFYTLGSLPTQSIYRVEMERPILFAAVSDPYVLGIGQEKSNITGMSDMTVPELPLEMINTVFPNKKKIGLIYSYGSPNRNEIMQVKKALEGGGKKVFDIVIQNEFELVSVLEQYVDKIEVLFSLCDNVVASSLRFILRVTNEYKIPLMTTFMAGLQEGALIASGTNYMASGKEIGKMAISILRGEKRPFDYMIKINAENTIYISKDIANRFEINLDDLVNKNNIILV